MRLVVTLPWLPRLVELTLKGGEHLPAALQVHLVQPQAENHSHCRRCLPALRRTAAPYRPALTAIGVVVRVSRTAGRRAGPSRCVATCPGTLSPVANEGGLGIANQFRPVDGCLIEARCGGLGREIFQIPYHLLISCTEKMKRLLIRYKGVSRCQIGL